MRLDRGFQGLVMDLGVSEGNDTAYYLTKGFRVVAVEADPKMCEFLRNRFKNEIESGALKLFNFAASDTFCSEVKIFVHDKHQGLSGAKKRADVEDTYLEHVVKTIDWNTLVAQCGVPRYLKIDIEGQEATFLQGMREARDLPEFVSVECYSLNPVEMLHKLGYERFCLVDQNPEGGFKLPTRQYEGKHIDSYQFVHSTGPFGLDVFTNGDWMDFQAFQTMWTTQAQPRMGQTWFDCHVWRPR